MLEQPTIEKLLAMRLQGMADAWKAQEQDPAMRELSSRRGSECWWTGNGAGARIKRWHGA